MLKRFDISKQLFITLSVSLVLFIVGLVWALPTQWKANAWVAAEFNMISDRYIPGQGYTDSGNLYVKASQWGNIVNKVVADPGKDHDITGVHAYGVAWYNKNSWPFNNTDVDWATVGPVPIGAGGDRDYDDYYLPNVDQYRAFYDQTEHAKQDVDRTDYWAGAFSTIAFNKRNMGGPGMRSDQLKKVIQRWAPNGTETEVGYGTKGWTEITITQ